MRSPEHHETPENELIMGRYIGIDLGNPVQLREFLENHNECKDFFEENDCELIEPLLDIKLGFRNAYFQDTIEANCHMSFDAFAVGNTKGWPWERKLQSKLLNQLKHDGTVEDDIIRLDRERYGFYVRLTEEHFAHIQFNNETQTCDVKISLEYANQLEDALDILLSSRSEPVENADIYKLFKRFTTLCSQSVDSIVTTFGNTSADMQTERPVYAISIPESYNRPSYEESFEEEVDTTKKSPNFDDIAGYEEIKDELLDMALAHQYEDVAQDIMLNDVRGILLYGIPGTGKTTLAKALANEIGADLVELSVSQIIDKYVGESAKKMDAFFEDLTTRTRLTVLLADEFDSLGASGKHASSSERVDAVNQLKKHLITISEAYHNIIIVGATNSLERVDESLIRSGRLHPVEVPEPNERGRQELWMLLIGKAAINAIVVETDNPHGVILDVANDVDIAELAKKTSGMVGADIVEILNTIRRKRLREFVRSSQASDITQTMQPITQQDILNEIRAIERDR